MLQNDNRSVPSVACAVSATVDSTGCRCFGSFIGPFQIAVTMLFAAFNSTWNWSQDGTTGCWQADFPDGIGYTDLAYVCLDGNGVPSLAAADDVGWFNNTLDGTRLAEPNRSLLPLRCHQTAVRESGSGLSIETASFFFELSRQSLFPKDSDDVVFVHAV